MNTCSKKLFKIKTEKIFSYFIFHNYHFLIVIILSLLTFSFQFFDIDKIFIDDKEIIPYEFCKFEFSYKQKYDKSCGIDTTATFLRYFYNIEINEKELIDLFFNELKSKNDFTISN